VARKVVQDLKLAENPPARAAFEAEGEGSIEDWLVEVLLKRLKVETSQSSIINATFSSSDPRFSARVADAFAKAYIDTMLELRVEPTRQAAAWYDEQLKSLRANLEDAQAKLTDYLQREGITSADERFDVDNTRLGALSEQVVRAQEQTFQWNAREQQARDFLKHGGSLDRLPDVLDNQFIQRLKADLLQGEAKLPELATQYGSNYPQYQRQLSENRTLRGKLDAEMKKIAAGIASSARQSRQREADLMKAMAAQRARLLELKENRNEFTVLRRNVESAEKAYDTAMQRHVVSQVESRASQTNVTVLNAAVVPGRPSQPKVALNIALSVVIGTMLGIALVMLMEMFDRRVRTRSDLGVDVPLLAVLNTWQPAQGRLLGRPSATARALPNPG
jgi:chain length determinant protein EpsF